MIDRFRRLALAAVLVLGAGCGGESSVAPTPNPPIPTTLVVQAGGQQQAAALEPVPLASGFNRG